MRLTRDDLIGKGEFFNPEKLTPRDYKYKHNGNIGQIRRVMDLTPSAKPPSIFAEGGIFWANALEELIRFRTRLQNPVTGTPMSLGVYLQETPTYINWIRIYGAYPGEVCRSRN